MAIQLRNVTKASSRARASNLDVQYEALRHGIPVFPRWSVGLEYNNIAAADIVANFDRDLWQGANAICIMHVSIRTRGETRLPDR